MQKSQIELLAAAVAEENAVTVASLIRNGVKYNDTFLDATGSVALIEAARRGCTPIVDLLLAQPEIKVNARDRQKETALTVACGGGHYDVVKSLLAHDSIHVNLATTSGQTALMKACYGRHLHTLSIVRLLCGASGIGLDTQRKDGKTAMHLAVAAGSLDVVSCLLDAGANPNLASGDSSGGFTPLMLAAHLGSFGLVRELIVRGVDPNVMSVKSGQAVSVANGAFKTFAESAIKSQQNASGTSGSASVPAAVVALQKKLAAAVTEGRAEREQHLKAQKAAASGGSAAAGGGGGGSAGGSGAAAANVLSAGGDYKSAPSATVATAATAKPSGAATASASASGAGGGFKPTGPVPKAIGASSLDAKPKK